MGQIAIRRVNRGYNCKTRRARIKEGNGMALTNDVVFSKAFAIGPINKGFIWVKEQIEEKMKGIIIKTRKMQKR